MKILKYILLLKFLFVFSACAMPIKLEDELPESFTCVLENTDYNFINSGAEDFYKEAEFLYNAKFFLQKGLSKSDEEKMFNLYKQAANLGDWRAQHKLVICYLYGYGTKISDKQAIGIIKKMQKNNFAIAYYDQYLYENVNKGKKKNISSKILYKAANMGSKEAQLKLASNYFKANNVLNNEEKGLQVLVCALRQNSGEAAYQIAEYLQNIEENYSMAMLYYWYGAKLGHSLSYSTIASSFAEKELREFTFYNKGYNTNKELSAAFYSYFKEAESNPFMVFPKIFEKHSIPENVILSKEEGYNKISKLKNAFNGNWPHEVFSEIK